MTPRDNCGSRLLQPLVSVTKIGTQVSCHSKSLFFHFPINQSIWAARDYGPGGRASARTAQGDGSVFGREAAAATAPGRINQKKNVDTGEGGGGVGGKEYVGVVLGAESLVEKRRARERARPDTPRREGIHGGDILLD